MFQNEGWVQTTPNIDQELFKKVEEYGEKSKSIIHKHFIIDVVLNIPSNLQCLI